MAKISILIALLLHLFCTKTTAVVRKYTTVSPSPNENNQPNANNECGTTSYYTDDTNRLMSNGEEIFPGQWPWLVALYELINDELVNRFMCTGTLLTTKHVITAAQCLRTDFSGNETKDSNYLYVAFGIFSLREWHQRDTINRNIASYKIHPDYLNTVNADSDLAILTLGIAIEYSPFIKPICLSDSTDFQNVVNKIGYVVGWGRNESGSSYTGEPRMMKMSIISQETCLRSFPVFHHITSNRTFCAGNNCNLMDSGSGLILFDDTKNRYQLRGVLARALKVGTSCDPRKYVVFVDVAKYVPWILQQISTT